MTLVPHPEVIGSMNHLVAMERYVSAHTADMESPGGAAERARPFITISRQAGAGGHHLADTLVALFGEQEDEWLFGGWQVFDRQLCEIVAGDPTHAASLSSLLAEEYRTKTDEFFRQLFGQSIDQDLLMHGVFRVVGSVASIGKSIIVGRAGSEVTRHLDTGISIRLVAPEETCIRGVMDYYELDERAARDRARKLDASRARLLKKHFAVDINDPTRYDLVWNTGRGSIEMLGEVLIAALRHKFRGGDSGS